MRIAWIFALWLPLFAAETVPNRYIVELNTEPVAEHIARTTARGARKLAMRGAEARQHRARLRTEQQRARGAAEANGATVLDTVDTVTNALLVQVPDAQAARLAALAGVRRVIPVRRARRMLDHAVPLHKVPEAWNLVGYDNA